MSYRPFVSMNIAIVGNTDSNNELAVRLADAGHNVFIGHSDKYKSCGLMLNFYDNITITSAEDAAASSEVVIINSYITDVKEFAYLIDDVKQKIVLDFTSFNYLPSHKHIDTLQSIKTITGAKNIIKCYSSMGGNCYRVSAKDKKKLKIFLAGEGKKNKEVAKYIFQDMGINACFDFGGDNVTTLLDVVSVSCNKLHTHAEVDDILTLVPEYVKR